MMKILVSGAGAMGANLAAERFAAGKDGTLPAGDAWADRLERDAEKHLSDR